MLTYRRRLLFAIQNSLFDTFGRYKWNEASLIRILEEFEAYVRKDERSKATSKALDRIGRALISRSSMA